ncbi:MAG: hypothetical protein V2A76_18360, partial [Planctomycetota bacterium]
LPIIFIVALSRGAGPADATALLQLFWADLTVTQSAFDLFTKFVFGAALIDLGMSLFTRRHEALHDLVSGTSVFREQRVKKKQRRSRQKKAILKKIAPRPQNEPINPVFPTVASLFVPGLGQLLNGQGSKGLVFFIGLVVAFFLAVNGGRDYLPAIIWGVNVFDANRSAHKRLRRFKQDPSAPNDLSDF